GGHRQIPAGAGAGPAGAWHAAHLPRVPLRARVAQQQAAPRGGTAGAGAWSGPHLPGGAARPRAGATAEAVRSGPRRVHAAVHGAALRQGVLGAVLAARDVSPAPEGGDARRAALADLRDGP